MIWPDLNSSRSWNLFLTIPDRLESQITINSELNVPTSGSEFKENWKVTWAWEHHWFFVYACFYDPRHSLESYLAFPGDWKISLIKEKLPRVRLEPAATEWESRLTTLPPEKPCMFHYSISLLSLIYLFFIYLLNNWVVTKKRCYKWN